MNNIVAIVVTYNRKELLKECIEALLSQSYYAFDILVVDNASTDGTCNLLAKYKDNPRVSYVNPGRNIGGAGGFNLGMKVAYAKGYEYMWIMDDDTIPNSDALYRLITAGKEIGRYGFLASNVLWTDGTSCKMNRPVLDSQETVEDFKLLKSGYARVRNATFVSLLIKKETIKAVGYPIKDYFIWGDDKEYTLRVSRYVPCYFVPASVVVHKMKTNVGSDISNDNADRISRYELAYRNDFKTAKLNGTKHIVEYLENYFYAYKKILCAKSDKKLKRIFTLTKGGIKGLVFNPKIEKENS